MTHYVQLPRYIKNGISMHLQDTYINDKLLAFALLYKHEATEAGQEWQSLLT